MEILVAFIRLSEISKNLLNTTNNTSKLSKKWETWFNKQSRVVALATLISASEINRYTLLKPLYTIMNSS